MYFLFFLTFKHKNEIYAVEEYQKYNSTLSNFYFTL